MHLASAFTLPSGLTLRHRIAKAATSEALADDRGRPTAELFALYRRFNQGNPSFIITGNVQVDSRYLERPGNVIVEDDWIVPLLTSWASVAQTPEVPVIVQISHAGRQTNRFVARQPVAPSAGEAVDVMGLFNPPRALTAIEIEDIRDRFVRVARWVKQAGFKGVQLHAAHGYLFNQFLSPLINRRDDEWGGSLQNRARLLLEVIEKIRAEHGPTFTISVKLNSADFQRGGFGEDEALTVIQWLEKAGVDLLEISGGSYEKPALFGIEQSLSTRSREAYFLDFARKIRDASKIPLMVTGGFRSRSGIEEALADGAIDIAGMARPILMEPDLPQKFLDGTAERSIVVPIRPPHWSMGAAAEAAFYDAQIARLAQGKEPNPSISMAYAIGRYMLREPSRALRRRFQKKARIPNVLG